MRFKELTEVYPIEPNETYITFLWFKSIGILLASGRLGHVALYQMLCDLDGKDYPEPSGGGIYNLRHREFERESIAYGDVPSRIKDHLETYLDKHYRKSRTRN